MKTKYNINTASITFDNILVRNSNIYQLLSSENGKENIEAEIRRIKHEIEIVKGFVVLKDRIGLVMTIISSSGEDNAQAISRLMKQFNISHEQAIAFIELSWIDINQINFELLMDGLVFFKTAFESFYRLNYSVSFVSDLN